MTAKSAPQRPVSPLNRASSSAVQIGGSLAILILAIALLAAGTAWLVERPEAPVLAEPQPQELTLPAGMLAAAGSAESVETPALAAASVAVAEVDSPAENSRYRKLSQFLAKRYKVSQAVTHDLVTTAYAVGHQIGVDPLLIIAMIAVESRFNPIAESVMGAKGLMQIIPKYHGDKLHAHGGPKAVFDPETNILVGSQIIKEYIVRTGNLNSALQLYGGVSSDANDSYFDKVMSEKQRLLQVLRRSS